MIMNNLVEGDIDEIAKQRRKFLALWDTCAHNVYLSYGKFDEFDVTDLNYHITQIENTIKKCRTENDRYIQTIPTEPI